jgi:hypothetical protein
MACGGVVMACGGSSWRAEASSRHAERSSRRAEASSRHAEASSWSGSSWRLDPGAQRTAGSACDIPAIVKMN